LEIESVIARVLQVLAALGGAYLIATWFVLAVWTFRDIESRSRSVVTQVFSTLLAVFFWIPGVLLYMMLRPKETLDEAYQRSLEEEYLLQDLEELPLCPSCNHFVHDDWQICPHCNTQLREPCPSCNHLVDLRWDICPYCGEQQHGREAHRHEEPVVVGASDRWIDPTLIEQRLREEAGKRSREETRALPAATAIDRDILSPAASRVVVSANGNGSKNSSGHAEADVTTTNGEHDTPAATHGPDLSSLIAEDTTGKERVKVPRRFKVE
jgi:RNA polymerase subunit RPABC4/transcription elongation factor Spt4